MHALIVPVPSGLNLSVQYNNPVSSGVSSESVTLSHSYSMCQISSPTKVKHDLFLIYNINLRCLLPILRILCNYVIKLFRWTSLRIRLSQLTSCIIVRRIALYWSGVIREDVIRVQTPRPRMHRTK